MAATGALAAIAALRPSLRHHALARPLTILGRPQARHISQTYLRKVAEAEEEFKAEAQLIREGKKQHIWDILKERGYIHQATGDDDKFREIMLNKRIGAYVGIDPTAPSLHVGHLVPLMALYWLYIHGYAATTVVGGATAKIGDPIGRMQGREPMSRADTSMNITKVHYQLKLLWQHLDTHAEKLGYKKTWAWKRALWNNSQWYHSVPFSEVVHKLFSGVRVGPMLSRDNVKRRLGEGGDGMSLSEFVYPLMQAWDWWHLYSSPKQHQMQIGGSDQYGNIISGIDAISHLRTIPPHCDELPNNLLNTPLGFTVPLLTDSSGAKFGKSAGNAVWLDPFMTSPFDLYAYFLRRPDADVETLLKLLTFLPLDKIKEIMAQQEQEPSKRHAHHALAYEVLCLIHGQQEAQATQKQHKALFTKREGVFTLGEQETYPTGNIPADMSRAARFNTDMKLPEKLILGSSIARILHAAGLASSVSEAHRLCAGQGAYIAGQPGQKPSDRSALAHQHLTFTPVKVWSPKDTARYLIDGKILILRRGKHFVRVIEMVSDTEWEASGKHYPGEPGSGKIRQIRERLRIAGGKSPASFKQDEVLDAAEKASQIEQESKVAKASGKPQIIFPVRPHPLKRDFKPGQDRTQDRESRSDSSQRPRRSEKKDQIIDRFLQNERQGRQQSE